MSIDKLQYIFAALTLLLAFPAYAVKAKRGSFAWAAGSALVAAIAARYNVFWVLAIATLTIPWALITAGNWVDVSWRARVGLCVFLALASALCLYPTYIDERFNRPDYDPALSKEAQAEIDQRAAKGEFGVGRWVRANIPFRLVRGLDLKGGFRVEYSVDVQEAIKDKRDRYYDDIRTQIARRLKIVGDDAFPTSEADNAKILEHVKMSRPREDVSKIIVNFESEEDAKLVDDKFLETLIRELGVQRTGATSITFRLRQEVEQQVRDQAVAQAKDKIHRRVDSLGLKEAAVSARDEDIVVEVPGNDRRQFEEIKDIIGQTARLEFKMLDDAADYFGTMARTGCPTCTEAGVTFRQENAPTGPNKSQPIFFAMMSKREGESINETLVRFKEWAQENAPTPDTHQIVFGKITEQADDGTFSDTGWRTYYAHSRAEVTGDMIRDARKSADQSDGSFGRWQVNMEFTPQGADRFERITEANINRRFAIILDEKVESAPVIQSKISGGSARITMGQGSSQEQLENATKLELVLRSGALPAPIEHKGEQQIGPSLGTDAIFKGVQAGAFGGFLVMLVMLLIYSRAGFIANLAVGFNLVLQIATLAMFGASMTLPGIAGLALTIGIAVDANVLINERIRDELRAGKTPRQAVDIGYDRAFTAIIDGHVTTFISGLILFQYGSGPIKGFAVTLMIGMIHSIFTGVVCTRLIFDWVVRWRKVKTLSLG
ncbi:MAG: protein translocase subunit SecD [Polyangiaceae bacterium]